MERLCGALAMGGELAGGQLVGGGPMQVRVATTIPEVRIGTTVLKKVRCDPELFGRLANAPDACLYVFWHFHTWPVILGVKYADGSKCVASPSWIRASVIQYIVMFPIASAFVGGILGEIAGSVTGLGTFLGGVGFLAGIGDSWWSAIRIKSAYRQAQRD